MIFGFAITAPVLAMGGTVMFLLLLFQLASGLRWIKLPPKRRLAIHKAVGITLVVLAIGHGSMGLILATGVVVG